MMFDRHQIKNSRCLKLIDTEQSSKVERTTLQLQMILSLYKMRMLEDANAVSFFFLGFGTSTQI